MALDYGRCRIPEYLGDMTQTEFARKIGVSDSFVTQVIKGKARFSLLKAKEAADALGCYVDDLYTWNAAPKKR